MKKAHELDSGDLRYFCDPKIFKFNSTADIDPLDEVIGQKRAVQAIENAVLSPLLESSIDGARGC